MGGDKAKRVATELIEGDRQFFASEIKADVQRVALFLEHQLAKEYETFIYENLHFIEVNNG